MTETDMFSQVAWEERYGSRGMWSGRPNAQLVAEVADLAPGRALDAGCGEGADAMWLAGQGWRVTAVDFSEVALGRARERSAGLDVEWRRADLTTWTPEQGAYDLVSAQFLHLPTLVEMYARLATGVAPGGTLLLVGHDPTDDAGPHRPQIPGMFFTADEAAGLLDPREWDVVVAGTREREGHGHGHGQEGAPLTVRDVVVVAKRR
ncbi:class I SAM-dependent methyltransferase [Pseudonocardia sp. KRD-184]|uniref:Class I SAM-dependent methyltransferase n=1 Tax=Pseudonocardia oceani TaxID=2792013 RepID=A0ABS6U961_9PSEU|nr:class I SAM-dependent methyltransferase [Pseudonocardia oceani]MBW0093635.1 class I SAM-dependent methyltransferase [Pseudonocardia oceani]MBW0100240.1 class I SAM-dependent methyltransferase [Pseudonocardia oceani]MBW0112953.1 class I SAM-dependent methyltransferase [Pseudonocardia oceani]MBW0124914.1 class I SAM-dependent methyltransferase [Pseudonocardia oceani]MBW0128768.1 class I SAM-dependent methyltransferase [Pseudonocardia oceani]